MKTILILSVLLFSTAGFAEKLPGDRSEFTNMEQILMVLSSNYEDLKDPACLKAALSEELVKELASGATIRHMEFRYVGMSDNKPYDAAVVFALKYKNNPGLYFFKNTGKRCKMKSCDSFMPASLCIQD